MLKSHSPKQPQQQSQKHSRHRRPRLPLRTTSKRSILTNLQPKGSKNHQKKEKNHQKKNVVCNYSITVFSPHDITTLPSKNYTTSIHPDQITNTSTESMPLLLHNSQKTLSTLSTSRTDHLNTHSNGDNYNDQHNYSDRHNTRTSLQHPRKRNNDITNNTPSNCHHDQNNDITNNNTSNHHHDLNNNTHSQYQLNNNIRNSKIIRRHTHRNNVLLSSQNTEHLKSVLLSSQNTEHLKSVSLSSQNTSLSSPHSSPSCPTLSPHSSRTPTLTSSILSQSLLALDNISSPFSTSQPLNHINYTTITQYPHHHSKAFRQTVPKRNVSRILMVGSVAFMAYQWYLWRTGNEKFFEELEKLENADEEELKKDVNLYKKVQQQKAEEEDRDAELRVPKLAVQFSREAIERPVDPNAESKLRDYEKKLGTITNDYTDEELVRANKDIDRQYLKLLMDTMDKIVIPGSRFLNYHTSYPAAHAILRVQQGASKEEVMENYRELMRINHPDVGGSPYLAAKITEAKELLYEIAPSDLTFMSKRDVWKKRIQEKDDEEYNEQLRKRLDIIQRRKEIMLFRQSQWGTPAMNREPMVVENEASRRVHNLDFGIMQMNRGEWPSIPFDGWKPRVFRTVDEDIRWDEYKKIKWEIKNAPIRREIEHYHEQQRREWEMIKFEQNRFKESKVLDEIRPLVSHRHEEELERGADDLRSDALYNTTANLDSLKRQRKSDFHMLRGTFGHLQRPNWSRFEQHNSDPRAVVDPELTEYGEYQLQQHLVRSFWPDWDKTERYKVTQWEPYQIWKHHRY